MKTVQEYYQDWYNKRSGDPEMDLAVEFVDKAACEFAEYYHKKQLALHIVSNGYCDICGENQAEHQVCDDCKWDF